MIRLVEVVISMVLIISLGWTLKRVKFIHEDEIGTINKIIVYVTVPALIFMAIYRAKLSIGLGQMTLFSILVMSICMLIAAVIGKAMKMPPTIYGGFLLVAAIGNTAFLGFPLTIGLYGQENLVRSVLYDFGTVLLLFSIGVLIAEKTGEGSAQRNILKEFILFPSILAVVLGIALHFLPLPVFLTTALDYLGAATVPLIMLTIGFKLEFRDVRQYPIPLLLVILVKLIISPLVALLVAKISGVGSIVLGVTVLEASMPPAMLTLAVCMKYELDCEFIAVAIVGSVVASLVTIPLMQTLIRYI